MRYSKIILTTFLLLATMIPTQLVMGESAAQVNGIEMSVDAGFDGIVKEGHWMPVQISVSNVGPSVDAVIRVASDTAAYEQAVSLPSQSEKRIEMIVSTDSTMTATLLVNNSDVLSERLSIRQVDRVDSLMYGVVSSNGEPLEFLDKIKAGRTDTEVALLDIEQLPTNSAAWRSLDILIFNDVDTNRLSAEQRSALDSWIRGGGQLVVTGGANWQKTTAALDAYLPVTVTGSQSVDNLPGFLDQVGEPFRDPGPYVIAQSSLKGGESLYFEGGTPILARRTLGRGNVFFLALDPQFAPLIDWDGSDLIWGTISSYVPFSSIWENGFPNESSVGSAVDNLPGLELPSAFLLIGFIGLYIVVIGPLNYVFLNRTERRQIAWLTIPAIIVVFSVLAYFIGFQFKGNQLFVNQIAMVTGRIGEPEVKVDAAVGVYSPRRGVFTVETEPNYLVGELQSYLFNDFNDPFVVSQDGVNTTEIKNVLIDVAGIKGFELRGTDATPEINAVVTLTENVTDGYTAEITITNNTGHTIEQATVIFQDDVFATDQTSILSALYSPNTMSIGRIPAGDTITRNVQLGDDIAARFVAAAAGQPVQTIGKAPDTSGSYVVNESPLEINSNAIIGPYQYDDPTWRARQDMLYSLNTYDDSTVLYMPGNFFVFTGWSEVEMIDVDIPGARYDTSGQAFYILEIPYQN